MRILTILALFFLMGSQAFAEAKVKKLDVNGYTVYLIDVQKGNQFGYVFGVPYGSADDPPELMGRAHFFEHMYSRGSTKHPGHETLIEAMTKLGIVRNASTGFDTTVYHGTGLEDRAPEAMAMHLATLFGIELSEYSMINEKRTVVNEIVGSSPNRPVRSVFTLPFMYLPEVGHPSRGQHTGTNETLLPMSDKNLRDLLDQIYHAGNVKVAVIGNFSSGKWNSKQIIDVLRAALPPLEHKKAPYAPAKSKPVFAKDQVMDIELKSERSGYLILPIDPKANIEDVRAFTSIYNIKARNSILEVGQREHGWLRDLSFSDYRIGDQRFLFVGMGLTETGYAKRIEVSQWVMDAIRSAGETDVSQQLIAEKANQTLEAGRRIQESVGALVSNVSSWLDTEGHEDKLMLDWTSVTAKVNNAAVRRGAQAIRFENKALSFVGPSIGEPRQYDSFFRRNYNIQAWQTPKVTVWPYDPKRLDVVEVRLPQSAGVDAKISASGFEKSGAWTVIGQDGEGWNDRTVSLRLRMRKLTPVQTVSAHALIFALNKKLTPELLLLQGRGVSLMASISNANLVIEATGTKGDEFRAIEWYLNELNSYKPTAVEIANYGDNLKLEILGSEDGFPGSVAQEFAQDLFSPRAISHMEAEQGLKSLKPKTAEHIRNILHKSDKTVIIAGKYDPRELEQLQSSVAVISPEALNARRVQGYQVKQSDELTEPWQDETKSGVGIARVYAGPRGDDLRGQTAMRIALEVLHEKIFLRNRPFGYVQFAGRMLNSIARQQIMFVGQADYEKQIPELEAVWDEHVHRWLNDGVEEAEIEKGRSSLVAKLSRQSVSSNDAATFMSSSLKTDGDPFSIPESLKIARELTLEEIKATAKKYLALDQPRLTLRKGVGEFTSCEDMLDARKEWRKANR